MYSTKPRAYTRATRVRFLADARTKQKQEKERKKEAPGATVSRVSTENGHVEDDQVIEI